MRKLQGSLVSFEPTPALLPSVHSHQEIVAIPNIDDPRGLHIGPWSRDLLGLGSHSIQYEKNNDESCDMNTG
ncbi:hypothetical protein J2W42_002321 [Rhizobium tibeticum]|uniref:Uncharacterized protein n=1 Tax=Rhizobium tibeticum TaxID=501024 RepID=A0A1H8UVA5_9HYPH|nr:hypothetical protein [Rhizobium tibeticum]SEI18024.1 hypothetical protein RTCCBAU85039_5756 [Rhizobium tibeticum]SEP06923.1 hypothetical protein SAMN05216228_103652 [Rhizobium tibeticum]